MLSREADLEDDLTRRYLSRELRKQGSTEIAPSELLPTMPTRLIIDAPDVRFYDGRHHWTPAVGDEVDVVDPVVVRTLIGTRQAREVKLVPMIAGSPAPTAADGQMPILVPTTATATEPSSDVLMTWADIPGISQRSRTILEQEAPDQDPRAVTQKQLSDWLKSDHLVTRVTHAIQAHLKSASEPAGGE